ncbi:unnamed protein product [Diplocarpon coronariae]
MSGSGPRSRSSSASSWCSFHTAPPSPMSPAEEDLDTAPLPQIQQPTQRARYRRALPLPDHLLQQCHIYLDEEIYVSALALLTDLVISGASQPKSKCPDRPVIAPLPYHIEMVGAFLIHPQYTHQAVPNGNKDLGSRPITFLRNVLAVLGPVNANLGEAFSLSVDHDSRPARRIRKTAAFDDGSSGSDTDGGSKSLGLIVANTGRIRNCARDFWHMVGWAFNCSVKHPRRWKYWKVWLEYMLDVLDVDWAERERQDVEDERLHGGEDSSDDGYEFKMRRQSLLLTYLSGAVNSSSTLRRVVRCAFSDGGKESLREFPEVFPDETREVKHSKRPRGDPTNRCSADHDDEEAERTFASPDLTDPRSDACQGGRMRGEVWLGGTESVALRQRVINLLSRVAAALPDSFADIKDVYREIRLCTWLLPLPAFSLFLSPSPSSHLGEVVFVSLTQTLLITSLPASAPGPETVAGMFDDELTQPRLEQCFLPFPSRSATVADNARVSILVESMFRLLTRLGACAYTRSLREAVDRGIRAREESIEADKRRRGRGLGRADGDMIWLRASGLRLSRQVAWMEQKG